ncbi:uncharacterized protein V3H82_019772 [Fundulus diaphanus]
MAANQNKGEELLKSEIFKRNAFRLICKMSEMTMETREDTSELVDEILHSIFFLGRINKPAFSPRELLDNNDEILEYFKEVHPEPFRWCSSRLPRRSPFSCVLDMVVSLKGQENEDGIRMTLQEIVHELMENAPKRLLFSTTLCVSRVHKDKDWVRHYGVSMSTTGRPAGQILVAASCLSFWNEYVADAVMSYYPQKRRKEYFNGTIQLPSGASCEAFNIRGGEKIHPCLSCKNLFGLDTIATRSWAYGNCAEVESLSNLLREEEARERVRRTGNWNEENRERVKREVFRHLTGLLKNEDGIAWDKNYYTPQRARPEMEMMMKG